MQSFHKDKGHSFWSGSGHQSLFSFEHSLLLFSSFHIVRHLPLLSSAPLLTSARVGRWCVVSWHVTYPCPLPLSDWMYESWLVLIHSTSLLTVSLLTLSLSQYKIQDIVYIWIVRSTCSHRENNQFHDINPFNKNTMYRETGVLCRMMSSLWSVASRHLCQVREMYLTY